MPISQQVSGLTGRRNQAALKLKSPYVLGSRVVTPEAPNLLSSEITETLPAAKIPSLIGISGSIGEGGGDPGGDSGITGKSPTGDDNADSFGLGTVGMDTLGGLGKTVGGLAANFSGRPTSTLGAMAQIGMALAAPSLVSLVAPASGMIGLGNKAYNALGAANTVAGMGMTKGQAHSANRSTPGDDMTNIGMEISNPALAKAVAAARRGEYSWGTPSEGAGENTGATAPTGDFGGLHSGGALGSEGLPSGDFGNLGPMGVLGSEGLPDAVDAEGASDPSDDGHMDAGIADAISDVDGGFFGGDNGGYGDSGIGSGFSGGPDSGYGGGDGGFGGGDGGYGGGGDSGDGVGW